MEKSEVLKNKHTSELLHSFTPTLLKNKHTSTLLHSLKNKHTSTLLHSYTPSLLKNKIPPPQSRQSKRLHENCKARVRQKVIN